MIKEAKKQYYERKLLNVQGCKTGAIINWAITKQEKNNEVPTLKTEAERKTSECVTYSTAIL